MPLVGQQYEAPLITSMIENLGRQRRRWVPKRGAPKWVTQISAESELTEYQLQVVIDGGSTPHLVTRREYAKLIRLLAKMRGHLQAIPEKGMGNG